MIESHCKEYSPYDVYLRSMYEYFKSREETVSEWENHESVIYQGLSQYQRDGYNSMVEITDRFSGAFLCDGVGLGKTYDWLEPKELSAAQTPRATMPSFRSF